jgi:hypothetical protein
LIEERGRGREREMREKRGEINNFKKKMFRKCYSKVS